MSKNSQLNFMTVDVEDWFHILEVVGLENVNDWKVFEERVEIGLSFILDVLQENNVKGIFFLLAWSVERNPRIVDRILSSGHMIGTHSYDHGLVYKKNQKEFENDLERSIELIYDACGVEPVAFRAPGFSVTSSETWYFESLLKYNIKIDASICAFSRAHGGDKKFNIKKPVKIEVCDTKLLELPVSGYNAFGKNVIYSGGGYFRFLPKKAIAEIMRRSSYNMLYFHPRDFDTLQPRLETLGVFKKWKTYVGLNRSQEKFSSLISKFRFIDPSILTTESFQEKLDTVKIEELGE
jgi:polysaccharide deacetylase family protein (PEP-CTERM system associated)